MERAVTAAVRRFQAVQSGVTVLTEQSGTSRRSPSCEQTQKRRPTRSEEAPPETTTEPETVMAPESGDGAGGCAHTG